MRTSNKIILSVSGLIALSLITFSVILNLPIFGLILPLGIITISIINE